MTTCSLIRLGRVASGARLLSLLGLLGLLGALSGPAQAALGDIVPTAARVSLATDAADAAATQSLAGGALRVTQRVDAAGTRVSEYVATASGQIVAYTWQGPSAPNLHTLLGRYAADFQNGAVALHVADRDNLHAARVDTPSVIVESGGLMRSYVGRAWLPGALPAGVSEGDLR
ncbi:DUF2844 domain-containing protein [Paraburkholderia sp. Ac-20340]|uniref:DUF2844 domain-containing protein n=1 Tax=Paraburkholderia sp. Ac-20340 TaxID=2703888 RepID=UPI00197DBF99|nr:DUF2844 domain-containing protein [Paraburkholderia sp. Ac-20340]MBN3856168.1 DUF2844 domain-containing protein [Paraburkholderia sp. Ac-20340]